MAIEIVDLAIKNGDFIVGKYWSIGKRLQLVRDFPWGFIGISRGLMGL